MVVHKDKIGENPGGCYRRGMNEIKGGKNESDGGRGKMGEQKGARASERKKARCTALFFLFFFLFFLNRIIPDPECISLRRPTKMHNIDARATRARYFFLLELARRIFFLPIILDPIMRDSPDNSTEKKKRKNWFHQRKHSIMYCTVLISGCTDTRKKGIFGPRPKYPHTHSHVDDGILEKNNYAADYGPRVPSYIRIGYFIILTCMYSIYIEYIRSNDSS